MKKHQRDHEKELRTRHNFSDSDIDSLNKKLNTNWKKELNSIYLALKIMGFKKNEIVAYAPYLKENLNSKKHWEDFALYKKALGDNPELIQTALKSSIQPQEIIDNPEKFSEKNIRLLARLNNI